MPKCQLESIQQNSNYKAHSSLVQLENKALHSPQVSHYLDSEREALGVIEGIERDVRDVTLVLIGGFAVKRETSLAVHYATF